MVKYVYTLGASGERIKVEELDRTVEYTYDELYRLTSETITEGKKVTTYTYAYDSVSNRTLKTVNGVETVYTYNSLNQLISENDTTYEYDNAGNLVRVIGTGKSALYEYNGENKLVKATVQQGNTVVVEEYTYDYEGNRTSKATTTSDGNVEYIQYLNDNSSLTNVLVEISNDSEVIYTVGADLISQEVDGEVYVYLYDGHGTVRALADKNGKITDTYSYDAFGNLLSSTGSTANNYLYCGEQFDETTGLYYLRARYMDTSTGRFISMDTYQGTTADPISLHKYLYANSNPVTYIDPSGYMSLLGEIAVTACIDILFYGVSSGLINVGLNLIKELKGVEGTDATLNFGYIIGMSFTEGFLTGAFFGACGMLAASLSSAAIYYALGGSSVLFALMSFGAAYAEGKAGNGDLALVYFLFGCISSVGAKNCFDSAKACAAAQATANSTTNPSNDDVTIGKGSAPKNGKPNSKYVQVDNENPNIVKSETTYNEQGNTWVRKDYYVGKRPRTHYNKTTGETYYDHMHIYKYNEDGYFIGEEVYPILPKKQGE